MATGKKPLSEAASPAPPGRTQKTAQRSQVARRRVIVGGVVALLAAGGLAFLLTRGDGIPIIDDLIDNREVPQVAFVPTVKVSTTTETKPGALEEAATPAGEGVATTITALFQGAFVDPDVWEGDDYEGVFQEVMTEPAVAEALSDVDVLTLGTGAGDVYDWIVPDVEKLQVRVLTDTQDAPIQAIATATFKATAEHDDGTYTKISVTGSYFLREEGGSWRIFAYDVERNEKKTSAPTSATPSAEASG
ncbi:MAG TPA: hypothetical protein VF235_06080 [Actinomycetota bacterium]